MSKIEEITESIESMVQLLKLHVTQPRDELLIELHKVTQKLELTLRKEVNHG